MRATAWLWRGGGRDLVRGAVLVAMILGVLAHPVRAETEDERLDALQARYRCLITAYLAAIHGTPMTPHERFLVIASRRNPGGYVQCLFHEEDRRIDCEAASGYYDQGTEGFTTSAQRATLAALGFSTDVSDGNFEQDRPVLGIETLHEVAGMLVETLTRIFDLQPSDILDFKAPLVPERPAAGIPGSRDCPALLSRL